MQKTASDQLDNWNAYILPSIIVAGSLVLGIGGIAAIAVWPEAVAMLLLLCIMLFMIGFVMVIPVLAIGGVSLLIAASIVKKTAEQKNVKAPKWAIWVTNGESLHSSRW